MASIIRGTTPTIEFTFSDISVADITSAVLVIKQSGNIVFESPIENATRTESSLYWTLTQEQTLALASRRQATVVCDWLLSSGVRGRTNVLTCDVDEPGKDEVMV